MMVENKLESVGRRLTCGMVGGGEGAFIGEIHRKALAFDRKAVLVAGNFSSELRKTLAAGSALGLSKDRLYETYDEMARNEGKRSDKIDFVIIVTPNNLHYAVAKVFLENGINVVCEKPLVFTSVEAEDLKEITKEKGLLFCVTYAYTGYPMVKQARAIIKSGGIGEIRFVSAEYIQDWLATPLEKQGNAAAAWRTDPQRSGASNCTGDIGTHAENMVSYMTGLEIDSLCAQLDSFVPGRKLDDNVTVMVKYAGGAKGLYWASQIAVGHDNDLRVRIFGTKGGLEWSQENPNYLGVSFLDKPGELLSRGRDRLYPEAERYSRIPSGHPEGYFEAFSNIYRAYCDALARKLDGLKNNDLDFPGLDAGAEGVKFVEKCVESSRQGAQWVKM